MTHYLVLCTFTVDYASALVLEVNDASGRYSEPFLTFKFKNGTEDPALHPVVLGRFGANTTSVPLSTFTSALEVSLVFIGPAVSSLTIR